MHRAPAQHTQHSMSLAQAFVVAAGGFDEPEVAGSRPDSLGGFRSLRTALEAQFDAQLVETAAESQRVPSMSSGSEACSGSDVASPNGPESTDSSPAGSVCEPCIRSPQLKDGGSSSRDALKQQSAVAGDHIPCQGPLATPAWADELDVDEDLFSLKPGFSSDHGDDQQEDLLADNPNRFTMLPIRYVHRDAGSNA